MYHELGSRVEPQRLKLVLRIADITGGGNQMWLNRNDATVSQGGRVVRARAAQQLAQLKPTTQVRYRTDPRHTDTATTKGLQGALAQCRLADNIILLNEAENI